MNLSTIQTKNHPSFKQSVVLFAFMVLVKIVLLSWNLFGPSKPIMISKETTHIVSPLNENGDVDYFAALQQSSKKGVTAKNNAVVLLWQAWGPNADKLDEDEFNDIPSRLFFKELGIPVPSTSGQYFEQSNDTFLQKGGAWLKSLRNDTGDDSKGNEIISSMEASKQFEMLVAQSRVRPWTSKQIPPLAKWLERNKEPLRVITQASKRTKFYSPILRDHPRATLVSYLVTTEHYTESSARAITTRGMLHLGEGRIEEAWSDAMTCLRLARLVKQSPTLIPQLYAASIDRMGHRLVGSILEKDLSAEQIIRFRKEIASLEPATDIPLAVDRAERYMYLDIVSDLSRHSTEEDFNGILGVGAGIYAHLSIDWNIPMKLGNTMYDKMVEAARTPNYLERKKAFAEYQASYNKQLLGSDVVKHSVKSMLDRDKRSELLANICMALLMPAAEQAMQVEDRAKCRHKLTLVGLELALYRAKHGEYPTQLAGLEEKGIQELTQDYFSGKTLFYQKKQEGYLLYSTGPNLKADGGTSSNDGTIKGEHVEGNDAVALRMLPNSDDVVLRLPLPKLDVKAFLSGN